MLARSLRRNGVKWVAAPLRAQQPQRIGVATTPKYLTLQSLVKSGAPFGLVDKRTLSTSLYLSSLLHPRHALVMKYVDGTCILSIPLPLSGFDEERVFTIPPETTVAKIVEQIQAEDATVKKVEIQSKHGAPFQPTDTLNTVLMDDFQLIINDRVMPVTAPVFTGNAYTSLLDDGDLDVRSVAHKAAIIALREKLERLDRWKISYSEYLELCQQEGIHKKQAREVLNVFHQAGIVFYFAKTKEEDLQDAIFLQPRSILDTYLESIGLSPLSYQKFKLQRDELLDKINTLQPQHDALANLEKELQSAATRHANLITYLSSTTLVGGFSLYFWLAFIHFSWDIMEPVTYFTGLTMSIVGYSWWSVTNQEYEYENIYDYFYKQKLQKLAHQAQFDGTKLQQVAHDIQTSRQQVQAIQAILKKPTCLQAKYLHMMQEQDEVDQFKYQCQPQHHPVVARDMARLPAAVTPTSASSAPLGVAPASTMSPTVAATKTKTKTKRQY